MSALAVTDTTSSPLSSPSPGPSTQEAPESEQNPSSRSGFYESGNALITGGTFVVNRRNQEVTSTPGPTPPTAMSPATFPLSPYSWTPDPSTGTQEAPESERNPFNSSFSFGKNTLITGGTFINNNILSADTGKVQKEMLESHKPSSSPLFIGRKDVLDKLMEIFVRDADSKLPSRRSCLLWGAGGTGKTQISLKFTEEISDRISHVFWVDASSLESIIVSLIGLSGIPADEADSAESALRWISDIQEEWLIVFDNADHLPPDLVARFIPPGKRGNILITSRSQSMGRIIDQSKERIIAPENVIEIRNEPDGV